MKKSDKKIDKLLREALTEVCDIALEDIAGFQWLTHFANYRAFPSSLEILCVFEREDQLKDALAAGHDQLLRTLITQRLAAIDIPLAKPRQQIRFDSEELRRYQH